MSIAAPLVSIFVFLIWSLCGWSIGLALLRQRMHKGRILLLAPVLGLCVFIIVSVVLSRLGFPVRGFGAIETALFVFAAVFLYVRIRPSLAMRTWIPAISLTFLAFVLSGWPMFIYGFNWISYGNDDMTAYLVSANHFFNHGWFDLPNLQQFLANYDPSWNVAFLYSNAEIRAASQILIAWVMSISGRSAGEIYMPLMVSLHLTLISTAGALAYRRPSDRYPAFLTMTVLSFSAMVSLGTMYELMPQVLGLSLLGATLSVWLLPFRRLPLRLWVIHSIASGITCGALLLSYPEVVPFFLLAFALFIASQVRRKAALRSMIPNMAGGLVATLIFVNTQLFGAISLIAQQTSAAAPIPVAAGGLFPYYLLPQGLSLFWGFSAISFTSMPEIWLQTSILLGAAMLVFVLCAAAWLAWKGNAAGALTVVMLIVTIKLFTNHAGFGLFKIAMYVEPFAIVTAIAALWTMFGPHKRAYQN